ARAAPGTPYGDLLPGPETMQLDDTDAAAGSEVGAPEVPVSPTYTLDNVYLTVKSIAMEPEFYGWLKSQITDSSPLEMPFTHWYHLPATTTLGNANSTLVRDVASTSIDMLLGTFKPATTADLNYLHPAQNSIWATNVGRPGGFKAGSYANTQVNRFFHRGGIDDSVTPFSSAWRVNNTTMGEPYNMADIWADLKEELNLGKANGTSLNPRLQNLDQFKKGFFIAPLRLNWKDSEDSIDSSRYLTGLDSRNNFVHVEWTTKGASQGNISLIPTLWVKTTAVHVQKSNQRVEVVW
ncbi:MAG: hypothetical protein ACRER5_04455, partial [Pseudomonas sp.]